MDKIKVPAFWTMVGTLLGSVLLASLSEDQVHMVLGHADTVSIILGCATAFVVAMTKVLKKKDNNGQ